MLDTIGVMSKAYSPAPLNAAMTAPVPARNGSTPLFMIDGLPQTEDMLNAVMPEDVDNLGVIRDGARLTFFMAQA